MWRRGRYRLHLLRIKSDHLTSPASRTGTTQKKLLTEIGVTEPGLPRLNPFAHVKPRTTATDKIANLRFLQLKQINDRNLTQAMMGETIKNITGIH
jgi:hypothetical protein